VSGPRFDDRAWVAARIDQTLLDPTVGYGAGGRWLTEQVGHGYASVCVAPFLVPLASEVLAGSATAVCTVVAFPLGYAATETKVDEAQRMLELGAHEIDMVMNVGAFLEGDEAFVVDDIAAVCTAVAGSGIPGALAKVILETARLGDVETIARAAALAASAGAAFVKTSTGFGPGGATVKAVAAMRAAVPADVRVKASGGIRDLASARAMIDAGADRIGTSAGAAILAAVDA
jgi:deoxyribose-phosphate aldolase